MKTLFLAIICMVMVFGSDVFARRGGGGGRSFSRPKSKSYSSNKSSVRPKAKSKLTPKQAKVQKAQAVKQKDAKEKQQKIDTGRKDKANSYSKMDKKLAKQNSAAGKKYGNKANAEKAYKEKMASKMTNKFDSKPAQRPEYIPRNYSAGGVSYPVAYNPMYTGYGYMGLNGWVAMVAMHYVVNDAMLSRHGYGVYGPAGQSVHRPGMGGLAIFFIFLGGIIVIVVIVGIIKAIE